MGQKTRFPQAQKGNTPTYPPARTLKQPKQPASAPGRALRRPARTGDNTPTRRLSERLARELQQAARGLSRINPHHPPPARVSLPRSLRR